MSFKDERFLPIGYPIVGDVSSYCVRCAECDYLGRIHAHILFSMLQEAASFSSSSRGISHHYLLEHNLTWMLSRVSLRMERMPLWMEKIHIDTWNTKVENLYYLRDFRIFDDEGGYIGAASSHWFLADRMEHKPLKASALGVSKDHFSPAVDLALSRQALRLRKLEVDFPEQENFTIRAMYSQIDNNMHVNNTNYIAWAMSAVHETQAILGELKGVDINYQAEILSGQMLRLYAARLNKSSVPYDLPQTESYAVEGRLEDETVALRTILRFAELKA